MAKDFDCSKCYHEKMCAYRMTFKDTIRNCNEYIPTADVVEVVKVVEMLCKIKTNIIKNVSTMIENDFNKIVKDALGVR